MADTKGLVDSGATDCFMSPAFVKRMGLGTQPLQKSRKIWNIDNTENKDGLITHCVDLDIQTKGVHRSIRSLITNIGQEDIVLGYLWLSTFEPQFNWTDTVIHEKALPIVIRSVNPRIPGKEPIIAKAHSQAEYIRILREHTLRATTSTDLAIAARLLRVSIKTLTHQ